MTGRSYLAMLGEAGLRRAEVREATGYRTSRYTEAHHIVARKAPPEATPPV